MRKDQLTESEREALSLHIAGATVRHRNPFSALPVPTNDTPMPRELLVQWVVPFYTKAGRHLGAAELGFADACLAATPELMWSLLGEFNWRPRRAAAIFMAVRRFEELQGEISNLFLRSDLCCVGGDYALALTCFNNEAAVETLEIYLDYYLSRSDLWFDQAEALCALMVWDETHGTNRAAAFKKPWDAFVSDKPFWNLENTLSTFKKAKAFFDETRLELGLA